jgi:hypothetical protein
VFVNASDDVGLFDDRSGTHILAHDFPSETGLQLNDPNVIPSDRFLVFFLEVGS